MIQICAFSMKNRAVQVLKGDIVSISIDAIIISTDFTLPHDGAYEEIYNRGKTNEFKRGNRSLFDPCPVLTLSGGGHIHCQSSFFKSVK